jgi:hypothetical protein
MPEACSQQQQQGCEEAATAGTTAAAVAVDDGTGCRRRRRSSSSSSSSVVWNVTGHPEQLTLEALAGSNSGWCCGCVQVQRQEQGCWVRFNLPAALKQDSSIANAAQWGLLVSIMMQSVMVQTGCLLLQLWQAMLVPGRRDCCCYRLLYLPAAANSESFKHTPSAVQS